MKLKFIIVIAFLLLAILVSACSTSRHHYPAKRKKKCGDCSKWSFYYQKDALKPLTFILQA